MRSNGVAIVIMKLPFCISVIERMLRSTFSYKIVHANILGILLYDDI